MMNFLERIYGYINPHRETILDGSNTIEIVDMGHEKVIRFNSIVYSRIKLDSLYTHQYWDFFMPIACIYDEPKILMIGLGGGTVIFQLTKLIPNRFHMDVIEVSPQMSEVAKKVLPNDGSTRIVIGEGAKYLGDSKDTYDMIILDAFVDAEIPIQFFTQEFIKNAYEHLSPNGILAINYLPQTASGATIPEFSKNLSSRFRVYKVNISLTALNIILVCSKSLNKEQINSVIAERFPEDKENRYIFGEYGRMEQLQ
jgi:spermidine synthase